MPKIGKFGALYARPGQRVLLDLLGDMQVRPTPLEMRLPSLNPCKQRILQSAVNLCHAFLWQTPKRHHVPSILNCNASSQPVELHTSSTACESGMCNAVYLCWQSASQNCVMIQHAFQVTAIIRKECVHLSACCSIYLLSSTVH